MNCQGTQEALGACVDGTLAADERRQVEAHLRGCAACATLAADLGRVRQLAGSLDRLQPPAAAWGRIAREVGAPGAGMPAPAPRLWRTAFVPLAAAACVLLAVVIGLVLRQARTAPAAPAATTTATPAQPVAERPELKTVADELTLAEQHYSNAIAGLETLANDRQVLDPQVAAELQKNLQVIDLAIDQSRAALRAQPASEPAQQSLFEAFRTKVGLLQDTIALINEMRKGNQAEAARIAEGLKKP